MSTIPDEQRFPVPSHPGPQFIAALERLAAVATALDALDLDAEFDALRARAREARFYVACVGEFKRGKSTLLNALVGANVLPTGIVPVTAVPTLLRFGPAPRARVRLREAGWQDIEAEQLAQYVAEEHNPGNAKQVVAVEVLMPSALLATGMVLVDTPGIGSIIQANTAATEAFVPQIDATIAVIGVDPPLTGEELALLARVVREAPHLIVVINKADRFSADERRAARAFAESAMAGQLSHSTGTPPSILSVSARHALDGSGPLYDWAALVDALQTLAMSSGAAMSHTGFQRGLRRLAALLQREIAERRAALLRPLEESERRAQSLGALSGDAQARSRELGALLAVEEATLAEAFARMRRDFRRDVEERALAALHAEIERLAAGGMRGPTLRACAMDAASDIAERSLRPWFLEQSRQAEALYRAVGERYVTLAAEFAERLLQTGDAEGDRRAAVAPLLTIDATLRARSQFFFAHMMTLGAPVAPAEWMLDVVLPRERQRARVQRAADRYLGRLMDTNVARVEGDVRERVLESRRALESELRRALHHVHESAVRALAGARAALASGADASTAERERLDALEREVSAITSPPSMATIAPEGMA